MSARSVEHRTGPSRRPPGDVDPAGAERSLLPRRRLLDDLARELPRLLVLHGGAGAGKTVLAAELADRLEREGRRVVRFDLPAGAGDDGVLRYALAVLGADTGSGAPLRSLVAEALRRLPDGTAIVVDGLDRAASESFREGLGGLLESIAHLRAIVLTRSLGRLESGGDELRLAGSLRIVDEAEMRFTEEEIADLVRLRHPRLARVEGIARMLHATTDGWPVAVNAAVVELGERGSSIGAGESGARFARRHVDGLLAGDAAFRGACLRSSLVAEVSPQVLARMLSTSPDEARSMLDRMRESGMRRERDDDGTWWFRHHDVVRAELRRRALAELDPAEARAACRAAAEALVAARPRLAISAAVDAKDWPYLARLLVTVASPLLPRRDGDPPARLSELPDEVLEAHPMIRAFALLEEFAHPRGRAGRVLDGFRALAGPAFTATIRAGGAPGAAAAVLRTIAARLAGRGAVAANAAAAARETILALPESELPRDSAVFAAAAAQLAVTRLHADEFDLALADAHLVREADRTPHLVALEAMIAAWRGDLARAAERVAACEALPAPIAWRSEYIGTGYRVAGAMLALERGDADRAEAEIEALAAHEETIEHWPYLAEIEALVAESRHGAGAGHDALERQLLRRRGRFRLLPARRQALEALAARLAWSAGLPVQRPRPSASDLASCVSALARDEAAAAARFARRAAADANLRGAPRRHAEALLAFAEASLRLDDPAAARRAALRAGAVMTAYGLTLPRRLLSPSALAALAPVVPALARAEHGPVAERERLELTSAERRAFLGVVEHGSVKAAASALFLSANTVRTHLKSVYRKLGVHRREDAVRAARELGLLDAGDRADGD